MTRHRFPLKTLALAAALVAGPAFATDGYFPHGYGIRANGVDVAKNTWTENSVFGNGDGGLNSNGAKGGNGSVSGAIGYREELRGQRDRALRLGRAGLDGKRRRRAARAPGPRGAAASGHATGKMAAMGTDSVDVLLALGDGQRRVGVVELHRDLGRQVAQLSVGRKMPLDQVLQRRRDEEVFLPQPQLAAFPRLAGQGAARDWAGMRRTLLRQRVFVEGARVIAYEAAHLIDLAEQSPDAAVRERAQDQAALLTPVLKSFLTDNGFALASEALQVFGGHGYTHDWGVEQCVRDARIAMIYEGTNEIQAIDLLQRKLLGREAEAFAALLSDLRKEAEGAVHVQPDVRPVALDAWVRRLPGLLGRHR